jgi:hypothetical protein
LNTKPGTSSLIPPIDGLDAVDFLDAENWLDGAELPGRLVAIGDGYISDWRWRNSTAASPAMSS